MINYVKLCPQKSVAECLEISSFINSVPIKIGKTKTEIKTKTFFSVLILFILISFFIYYKYF